MLVGVATSLQILFSVDKVGDISHLRLNAKILRNRIRIGLQLVITSVIMNPAKAVDERVPDIRTSVVAALAERSSKNWNL